MPNAKSLIDSLKAVSLRLCVSECLVSNKTLPRKQSWLSFLWLLCVCVCVCVCVCKLTHTCYEGKHERHSYHLSHTHLRQDDREVGAVTVHEGAWLEHVFECRNPRLRHKLKVFSHVSHILCICICIYIYIYTHNAGLPDYVTNLGYAVMTHTYHVYVYIYIIYT